MKKLPERTGNRLLRYRDEPTLSVTRLRDLLKRGLKEFLAASQESEHADGPLGVRLYHAFELLLERPIADEDWPRVQAAAHYLVDSQDEEDDLESPVGMVDDAEVFNDLCIALGYPDLKVSLT
ncbi:MAG: hypothetical protein AB1758_34760 [Candidatus Eremiobacterota bacterium]